MPPFLKLRLRLVDFFVKMCLLKAFWKVIFPVPVTLKRFFALELVLTFGITIFLFLHPAGVPNRRKLMEPYGQYVFRCCFTSAKHKSLMGCKSNELW
jgi:hypothetical protein